jgi:four helix bundle protein
MSENDVKSYKDLVAWKKAMDLVEKTYRLSSGFPPDERYGLTSQIQRAAVSVPANIAEGHGRTTRGDYIRHLSIARGSLAELETHLMLAVRLEFVPREEVIETWNLSQEVGKMLTALLQALRKKGSRN